MTDTVLYSVRIPKEMKDKIDAYAKARSTTTAELVRKALTSLTAALDKSKETT